MPNTVFSTGSACDFTSVLERDEFAVAGGGGGVVIDVVRVSVSTAFRPIAYHSLDRIDRGIERLGFHEIQAAECFPHMRETLRRKYQQQPKTTNFREKATTSSFCQFSTDPSRVFRPACSRTSSFPKNWTSNSLSSKFPKVRIRIIPFLTKNPIISSSSIELCFFP